MNCFEIWVLRYPRICAQRNPQFSFQNLRFAKCNFKCAFSITEHLRCHFALTFILLKDSTDFIKVRMENLVFGNSRPISWDAYNMIIDDCFRFGIWFKIFGYIKLFSMCTQSVCQVRKVRGKLVQVREFILPLKDQEKI